MGNVALFPGMTADERKRLAYFRLLRCAIGLGPKCEREYQRLMVKAGLWT